MGAASTRCGAAIRARACEGHDAACWVFIRLRFDQLLYGPYPASERWRVDVVAALAVLPSASMLMPVRRTGARKLVGLVGAVPVAARRRAAARRRHFRPQARPDHRLGRHHAQHRDRRMVDRDRDPARPAARARPPLRNAGDLLRLRHLHRAVAQPAADRRAVPRGRDVSAVRAGGLRVRPAGARADRLHAVQRGDLRGSLPRRLAGDPARPARGRAQPRARLLAHDRARSCCRRSCASSCPA